MKITTSAVIPVLTVSFVSSHKLGDTRTFSLNRAGVCTNTWHRYECQGRPIAEAILKQIAANVEWHNTPMGQTWVGSKTLNKVQQGRDGFLKVIVREAPLGKVDLLGVYMLGEDDLYTDSTAIQCNPVPYP